MSEANLTGQYHAQVKTSCPYSVMAPEVQPMEDYVSGAFKVGIIQRKSSPVARRPCVDYRSLHDITLKNRYPLPLISCSFCLLQGHSFYKLRIREGWSISQEQVHPGQVHPINRRAHI